MSDAYSVRFDGQRYWVYRNDGNVPVGEFFNGAEAQRSAAVRNQQWNEQMGKKKELETSSDDSVGKVQTRPYPVPQKQETPPPATKSPTGKTYKVPDSPNPPPGQGANY